MNIVGMLEEAKNNIIDQSRWLDNSTIFPNWFARGMNTGYHDRN